MSIEKISCPRLNKFLSEFSGVASISPRGEVFVQFTPSNAIAKELPNAIMCPLYMENAEKNSCYALEIDGKKNEHDCIYAGWRKFN